MNIPIDDEKASKTTKVQPIYREEEKNTYKILHDHLISINTCSAKRRELNVRVSDCQYALPSR